MAIKAMIEESMELFAYLLLTFSSVEAVIFSRVAGRQIGEVEYEISSPPSRARIAA